MISSPMETSHLFRLADLLGPGLAQEPPDRLSRHRDFLLARQQTDGGFADEAGDSNRLATGFAIRALTLIGGPPVDVARPLARFLRQFTPVSLETVELLSWLDSVWALRRSIGDDLLDSIPADWQETVVRDLEKRRCADGGYAQFAEATLGSMHSSHLTYLIYQLLGREIPRRNQLIEFIKHQQCKDGGFAETDPQKHGSTQATAAAVTMLKQLGELEPVTRVGVHGFLLQTRAHEGGFQANIRIPFADALSTFVGLLTMHELKLYDVLKPDHVDTLLAQWLELPDGGFRPNSWEERADIEQTYYGLGCLGMIHVLRAAAEE